MTRARLRQTIFSAAVAAAGRRSLGRVRAFAGRRCGFIGEGRGSERGRRSRRARGSLLLRSLLEMRARAREGHICMQLLSHIVSLEVAYVGVLYKI